MSRMISESGKRTVEVLN